MPTKKPVRAKKTVRRGEKKRGLTSAIGPKATTALVIVVLAGGLVIGQRLRPGKDHGADMVGTAGTDAVLAPDSSAPKTPAAKKTADTPGGETAAGGKKPVRHTAGRPAPP